MTARKAPAKKAAPRKPAQPGDSNYDWSKEYPGEEVFTYTLPNGKLVGLAALSETRKFTIGEIRRGAKMNEVQQVLQTLEKIACPAALDIVDECDDAQFSDLMFAWAEWLNTSMGESSAP